MVYASPGGKALVAHWCRSNISKVMVLSAVVQSRQVGGAHIDGLICIYAFTENHIYRRHSKHHAKGDQVLVTKNVDAEVYRKVVETSMIPDIMEKIPL